MTLREFCPSHLINKLVISLIIVFILSLIFVLTYYAIKNYHFRNVLYRVPLPHIGYSILDKDEEKNQMVIYINPMKEI